MKPKLNTRSAFLVVLLYLALSIIAALLTTIFFGGPDSSETDRLIDGVIDSGMLGTIIVLFVLLFISIYLFKDSRRDIFFERKPFALSKLYYLFPLAWLGVRVCRVAECRCDQTTPARVLSRPAAERHSFKSAFSSRTKTSRSRINMSPPTMTVSTWHPWVLNARVESIS